MSLRSGGKNATSRATNNNLSAVSDLATAALCDRVYPPLPDLMGRHGCGRVGAAAQLSLLSPAGGERVPDKVRRSSAAAARSVCAVQAVNILNVVRKTAAACGGLRSHGWRAGLKPGFKSQPRRCRVTVLGKLFTPIVSLFTKQRNWQQPS